MLTNVAIVCHKLKHHFFPNIKEQSKEITLLACFSELELISTFYDHLLYRLAYVFSNTVICFRLGFPVEQNK